MAHGVVLSHQHIKYDIIFTEFTLTGALNGRQYGQLPLYVKIP